MCARRRINNYEYAEISIEQQYIFCINYECSVVVLLNYKTEHYLYLMYIHQTSFRFIISVVGRSGFCCYVDFSFADHTTRRMSGAPPLHVSEFHNISLHILMINVIIFDFYIIIVIVNGKLMNTIPLQLLLAKHNTRNRAMVKKKKKKKIR